MVNQHQLLGIYVTLSLLVDEHHSPLFRLPTENPTQKLERILRDNDTLATSRSVHVTRLATAIKARPLTSYGSLVAVIYLYLGHISSTIGLPICSDLGNVPSPAGGFSPLTVTKSLFIFLLAKGQLLRIAGSNSNETCYFLPFPPNCPRKE